MAKRSTTGLEGFRVRRRAVAVAAHGPNMKADGVRLKVLTRAGQTDE